MMAGMYTSDNFECECGNDWFEERKLVQFHKSAPFRTKMITPEDLKVPMHPMAVKYIYVCTACGKELKRNA